MSHDSLFENNCPIRERTADGISVGRCWYYLRDGCCQRHGDVSKAVEHYKATGELSELVPQTEPTRPTQHAGGNAGTPKSSIQEKP